MRLAPVFRRVVMNVQHMYFLAGFKPASRLQQTIPGIRKSGSKPAQSHYIVHFQSPG
jgi:hypothetical protein